MALTEVNKGCSVIIDKIGGQRRFRLRLMELGMTPGTMVKVVRSAPFGDPIEIEIRNFHISLRKNEAKQITVRA